MAEPAPRLLFVPVSGPFGRGEYARSLAIAQAVASRWRDAVIHFVLSRQAPYAAAVPFAATLLDSSATFHTGEVVRLIETFRPDVVVFDNAGRTAQLRAARRQGAAIVYISARPRQRRKAFRRRWMRLIDEHWIAYPEFIAGRLGILERLKLRLLARPTIRYLDVVMSRAEPAAQEEIFARCGCARGSYVLVVPGGGSNHPGKGNAVDDFMAASRELAQRGIPTVFVGPIERSHPDVHSSPNAAASPSDWHLMGILPQVDLAQLMRGARLIVANGGSTLLQAIACGGACVGVPIAKDQRDRLRRCVDADVAVAAPLDAAKMVQITVGLLHDEPRRLALKSRAGELRLADGVSLAVEALGRLSERSGVSAEAATRGRAEQSCQK